MEQLLQVMAPSPSPSPPQAQQAFQRLLIRLQVDRLFLQDMTPVSSDAHADL